MRDTGASFLKVTGLNYQQSTFNIAHPEGLVKQSAYVPALGHRISLIRKVVLLNVKGDLHFPFLFSVNVALAARI